VLVVIAAAATNAGSAAASPGTAGSACAVTVTGQSGAGAANGVKLSAAQMNNARIIVAVVRERGLPEHAAEISLMTSMDESSLTVVDHGDEAGPDSRGLFQQRDSWGPLSVRMDPAGSTGLFLNRLVTITHWQTIDPVQAAHQVQGNANAEDYRRWQAFGVDLAAALWSNTGTSVRCTGGDPTVTGSANSKTQAALTAAHNQLGLPYCWDAGTATGPSHGAGGAGCGDNTVGFDCSGLVLYAWAQAGITLPHFTGAQYASTLGRKVPITQVQPGDLVFLSNAADGIHHVAMIWSVNPGTTGTGQIIEASDFNVPVRIRAWHGTAEPEVMPYALRLAG
jgi:cell wall-associated NlpC family hydrolase